MPSSIPQPDSLGHWGQYGGRFVPETLMAPLEELTTALFRAATISHFNQNSKAFYTTTQAGRRLCFTPRVLLSIAEAQRYI